MPTPVSKKQVRQIGKLLAAEQMHPSNALYVPYQAFLAHCDSEQSRLENRVREIVTQDYSISGRRKSRNTLREKLQSMPTMQLTHIRDLVGVRIVGTMTLEEQDELASTLISELRMKSELIDRRLIPNNGYRALHIEVKLDGITGEIQIRTPLQSAWADSFERLADIWGRQIRYGQPPSVNSTGSNLERIRIVEQFIELSTNYIREFENESNQILKEFKGIKIEPVAPKVGASKLSILSAMRNRQTRDRIRSLEDTSQGILQNWRQNLLSALEDLARQAEEVE